MRYIYHADLAKACKPGNKVWISSLRLSKDCQSITQNIEPTLAELCCSLLPDEENAIRAKNMTPCYAVPVRADGSLAWTSAIHVWGIDIQADREAAEASYLEDISLAKEKILSQRGLLDAIDARLDKLAAEQKGGKEPGSMA